MNLFYGTLCFNKTLTIPLLKKLYEVIDSNPLDTTLVMPTGNLLFKEVNFKLNSELNGIVWNGQNTTPESLQQQIEYIFANLNPIDDTIELIGDITLSDPVTSKRLRSATNQTLSLTTVNVANDLEGHVTSLYNGLLKASQLDATKIGSIEQGKKLAYAEIAKRLKTIIDLIPPPPPPSK